MADASRAVETGSGEAPLPIVLPNVGSEIQALDSESQVKKPEPLTDLIDQSNDSTQIEYDDVDTFPQDVIILTINADPEPSIETNTQNSEQGWRKREQELLRKIEELEKSKREQGEDSVKLQLKVREDQIDLLKTRVHNLETKLEAALSKPTGKNHEMIENIKQQHEELLNKARGMIFEKTKMLKNQELQIEALTSQVQSLKDVNVITKDLLDIRNSEVKAMEDRLQVMEARFKAEKERYDLVLRRAQTSTNINDDLRKEYETQLAIFKELREKYEQRVQALVAENNRLKGSAGGSKEPPTQAQ